MLLHYVEMGDGTRHVHKAECGELDAQIAAGEVWELEFADDVDEDTVLIEVWEGLLDAESSDDEFDTYAELTVFRRCTLPLLPPAEDESSGNPKADDWMDEAVAAGWDVEFEWVDNDVNSVSVVAKREYIAGALRTHEELHLAWYKNKLEYAGYSTGHEGDVFKRLSSVAAARPYLTGTPPQPKLKQSTSARQVDREQPVKRVLKKILPFDIEEAYDDEILAACRGKRLIWWNNIAEDYDSATVIGKNPNHYYIETGTAGRAILTFCSFETGYRSVALEDLVQVK
jgi:hypothetical protein